MEKTDQLQIEGLAGQRVLTGQIKVGGAKNAVLKVLASSVLFRNGIRLANVPAIEDVRHMLLLLESLGLKTIKENSHQYTVKAESIKNSEIEANISKHFRASVVLSGPVLARTGRVIFPHPGGCVIGKRPIDFFLEGFIKMGAKVKDRDGAYEITAANGRLQGAELFFRVPSVTGTETFMMAAILAFGQTVIKNAALEPEIISLGEFLKTAGARISGLGTPTITITGGKLLNGTKKIYQTIPDRIEAGSFLILAALAARDVTITDLEPKHLDALIDSLSRAGVKMTISQSQIRITGDQPIFKSLEIKTHEYPGFPTDLQAPLAVFMTQAAGQSYVFETVFEGRLNYLETLNQMGAKTRIIDVHRAFIEGPTVLSGREMVSPDLRAGLAYVLAAIIAKGRSVVHNVHYIDRGYEKIDDRLAALGVNIKRTKNHALLDKKTGD